MVLWKKILFLLLASIIVYAIGSSFYISHRKRESFKYYRHGEELTRQRDFLNANLKLKKAFKLGIEIEIAPYARFLIASNYIAMAKYKQAIEEYEKLIFEFPGHEKAANARFMIAMIYMRSIGNSKRALENFKKYISDYPLGKSRAEVKRNIEKLKK